MDEITKLKAQIYDLGKQQQQAMLRAQQAQAEAQAFVQKCDAEAMKLEGRIELLAEQAEAKKKAEAKPE